MTEKEYLNWSEYSTLQKNFFSIYDQIHGFLRIWSHLLKKSLMENFIFCSVPLGTFYFIIIENLKTPKRQNSSTSITSFFFHILDKML